MTDKPSRTRDSASGHSRPAIRHVVPAGDGWAMRSGGHARVSAVFGTRDEAVKAAREAVEAGGGRISIRGREGRARESMTLGRDPFTKISAVEGITPTKEARRRAAEFEKHGLSSEERRRAIIKAFRVKP